MSTEAFPLQAALPALCLSLLSVSALVISDRAGWRAGRYLFKPLAALAFVWLALGLGAAESGYGRWLLAGLLCCLLGDLLLMPDQARTFLAGLIAFLCGHLLYAIAFLQLGTSLAGLALSVLPVVALLIITYRWLLPAVEQAMKLPVGAYMCVISGMLLCAGLTLHHPAAALIIVGAWGFAVSDLAVARQQFVQPDPNNALWGTPLYFAAQMLLAGSVALAG